MYSGSAHEQTNSTSGRRDGCEHHDLCVGSDFWLVTLAVAILSLWTPTVSAAQVANAGIQEGVGQAKLQPTFSNMVGFQFFNASICFIGLYCLICSLYICHPGSLAL